jgi:hypothetical protein
VSKHSRKFVLVLQVLQQSGGGMDGELVHAERHPWRWVRPFPLC